MVHCIRSIFLVAWQALYCHQAYAATESGCGSWEPIRWQVPVLFTSRDSDWLNPVTLCHPHICQYNGSLSSMSATLQLIGRVRENRTLGYILIHAMRTIIASLFFRTVHNGPQLCYLVTWRELILLWLLSVQAALLGTMGTWSSRTQQMTILLVRCRGLGL